MADEDAAIGGVVAAWAKRAAEAISAAIGCRENDEPNSGVCQDCHNKLIALEMEWDGATEEVRGDEL